MAYCNQSGTCVRIRLLSEVIFMSAFDRVILASFHSDIFREFKRLDREGLVPDSFMYSPGITGAMKYYVFAMLGIDSLYRDGTALLQIPMKELGISFAKERIIRVAREHNLAVHYWTVDDPDDMRRLIELGADAIMTDKPTLLKQVLEEYK